MRVGVDRGTVGVQSVGRRGGWRNASVGVAPGVDPQAAALWGYAYLAGGEASIPGPHWNACRP